MIPTATQYRYVQLMDQVIRSRAGLAWIKTSYICAEVAIESGWDATVVNASGRQDGLMQVIPGTVAETVAAYGLSVGPQTDPYSSLLVGTCYFDLCARKILASRGTRSLYLVEVAEAYNAGYAGFLSGHGNPRYGMKFLAQQAIWGPIVDGTGNAIMARVSPQEE